MMCSCKVLFIGCGLINPSISFVTLDTLQTNYLLLLASEHITFSASDLEGLGCLITKWNSANFQFFFRSRKKGHVWFDNYNRIGEAAFSPILKSIMAFFVSMPQVNPTGLSYNKDNVV
jgi:hypothetical protein